MLEIGDKLSATITIIDIDNSDNTMCLNVNGTGENFWISPEDVVRIDPVYEERMLSERIKKDSERLALLRGSSDERPEDIQEDSA